MRYRPLVLTTLAVVLAAVALMAAGAPLIRALGPLLAPEALFYVPTTRPAVALTIDDAPSAETTPAVLDVLREHDVQATFFLLGARVNDNLELVQRMLREGHEIASHGLEEQASVLLDDRRFEESFAIAHGRLSTLAPVRWFRPGSGLYRERARLAAERYGYRLALGDIYPYDTLLPSSRAQILYIDAWLRPGSVIILHDARRRGSRLPATLDELIPRIRHREYELMTLSELHGLRNHAATQGSP